MLLENLNSGQAKKFRKLNKLLRKEYGIQISESSDYDMLGRSLIEINERINDLKLAGRVSSSCPELSKSLLMRDAIDSLMGALYETMSTELYKNRSYNKVIDWLSDFVVRNVELGDDIDDAIEQAMKTYRSSQWRFPDELVRADVLQKADEIMTRNFMPESDEPLMDDLELAPIDDEDEGKELFNPHDKEGFSKALDITRGGRERPRSHEDVPGTADKLSGDLDIELVPKLGDLKSSKDAGRETFNRYRITPARKLEMKENLVKGLRKLLESEVSEAEIVIAVKGIGGKLQEMIERLGRLQNEDIPPLTEQMRETFGPNTANVFMEGTTSSLQSVMDALYSAKDEIDDAVDKLANSGGNLTADTDMDLDMTDEIAPEDEFNADMGIDQDVEDLGDLEDEFAGDESDMGIENPLGREKKESVEVLKRKIEEMELRLKEIKPIQEKKKPSAGLSKKKKSEVVKKARKGKDIGKKGKNFDKVVANAKKYGAKDPEAVAAAAMWKNIK